MKTVNPYFLHVLLGPLTGLADDDASVKNFSRLNSDDEFEVRTVIRNLLVPGFKGLPAEMQECSKRALAYYLSKPTADFGRVYEACLPPFDAPSDPRHFFVWLWHELFPNEGYEEHAVGPFREVADIEEPNRIAAEAKNRRPGT